MLPFLEGVQFRIFFKPESLISLVLPHILHGRSTYGYDSLTGEQHSKIESDQLVIEFSSPNITSEFQGKHLRSTIIGAFIGRLYESIGWKVARINYLGDWGKPIALLHVGWEKYGSEEAYQADPIGHLLEVYHKIDEDFRPEQLASKQARDEAVKEGKDESEAQANIESKGIFAQRNEAFKKLEEVDEEMVAFWMKVRNANIDNYKAFYGQLGVQFDEYSGESQISQDTMVEIEQLLRDKDISEESGGACIVHMQKVGAKAGTAIIRDRSGSSTYLLRDLAAVLERSRKYSFDKMIYVVASDNSVHFNQLFKILEALEFKDLASKLQHVKFSESSKMSAVLGKGYKPQAILEPSEKAVTTLSEVDPEKANVLGNSEQATNVLATSSLLVQELSTRMASVHSFDTSTLANFKPGSGPDLQYWLAKVSQLSSNAAITTDFSEEDLEILVDEDQSNLLRVLAQYPEVVNATYHSLESSGIVTYLAGVSEQLSECIGEDEGDAEVSPGLAALYVATKIVLDNGLRLLGLTPLTSISQERADTPVAG